MLDKREISGIVNENMSDLVPEIRYCNALKIILKIQKKKKN